MAAVGSSQQAAEKAWSSPAAAAAAAAAAHSSRWQQQPARAEIRRKQQARRARPPAPNPQGALSKSELRAATGSSTHSRARRGHLEGRTGWARGRSQAQRAEPTAMTKSLSRGFGAAGGPPWQRRSLTCKVKPEGTVNYHADSLAATALWHAAELTAASQEGKGGARGGRRGQPTEQTASNREAPSRV